MIEIIVAKSTTPANSKNICILLWYLSHPLYVKGVATSHFPCCVIILTSKMFKSLLTQHITQTHLLTIGAVALLIYLYAAAQGLTLPMHVNQHFLFHQSSPQQPTNTPTPTEKPKPTPTRTPTPTIPSFYYYPAQPTSAITPAPSSSPAPTSINMNLPVPSITSLPSQPLTQPVADLTNQTKETVNNVLSKL